jgi:hypothetical protein
MTNAVQYAFSLEPSHLSSEPFAHVLEPLEASTGQISGISSPIHAETPRGADFLAVSNPDGKKAHRDFLHDWAVPRFLAKRGEPCNLIQCNPADLAAVGDLPGVVVRPDPYVQRRTFYLARVDSEEISA